MADEIRVTPPDVPLRPASTTGAEPSGASEPSAPAPREAAEPQHDASRVDPGKPGASASSAGRQDAQMAVTIERAQAQRDITFAETTQYFVGTTREAVMRSLSPHDGWHVTAESERTLARLFVCEQSHLEELVKYLIGRRALVLTGEPDSGRTSAALSLRSFLKTTDLQRPTWLVPPLDPAVRVNLREFVFDSPEVEDRLVVFSDVFARGNRDFESSFLRMDQLAWDNLSERLRQRRAYLVFTSSAASLAGCRQQLEQHQVCHELNPLSRDLLAVAFDRRLGFHEETAPEVAGHISELKRHRDRVVKEFDRVAPLARFVDFFVRQGARDPSLDDELRRFRGAAGVTLRQLAPNREAWIFVVTLGLSHGAAKGEGVPWVMFERLRQIVADIVAQSAPQRLRESLPDESARQLALAKSDDELLVECQAEIVRDAVSAADIIRFRREVQADQYLDTMLRQHRRFLLALVEPLRDLAEDGERADVGMRDFAAQILGRLGELDSGRLFTTLVERWTGAGDRTRRALIGAAFEGALRSSDARYRAVCLSGLERFWREQVSGSEGDRKDRILTTLAACARVGVVDLPAAMSILGDIAAERLAPANYDAQRLTRLLDTAERELTSMPDSERTLGMLLYQSLLRELTSRLYSQHGSTVVGLQRALTSLCLSRDPMLVILSLRQWIARGGAATGLLVALLFLQEGGLASQLRQAQRTADGRLRAPPDENLILLALSGQQDAVLTMALFLADIHDSFSETFTVPFESQRFFRESLGDHLRGWVEDAMNGGMGREAMMELLVVLSSVRQRRLFDLVHQVLTHERMHADPSLREFAESVRLRQMS